MAAASRPCAYSSSSSSSCARCMRVAKSGRRMRTHTTSRPHLQRAVHLLCRRIHWHRHVAHQLMHRRLLLLLLLLAVLHRRDVHGHCLERAAAACLPAHRPMLGSMRCHALQERPAGAVDRRGHVWCCAGRVACCCDKNGTNWHASAWLHARMDGWHVLRPCLVVTSQPSHTTAVALPLQQQAHLCWWLMRAGPAVNNMRTPIAAATRASSWRRAVTDSALARANSPSTPPRKSAHSSAACSASRHSTPWLSRPVLWQMRRRRPKRSTSAPSASSRSSAVARRCGSGECGGGRPVAAQDVSIGAR